MLSVKEELFPKRFRQIKKIKERVVEEPTTTEKASFSTLLSMFQHLVQSQKKSERELISKLEAFYFYVCHSKQSQIPQSFVNILKENKEHLTITLVYKKKSFFSPIMIQLFCYLYSFRLRIEQREGNKIIEQYFGKPKQRFVNLNLSNGYLKTSSIQKQPNIDSISHSNSDFIIKGDISNSEFKKNILDLAQEKTNDTLLTQYNIRKEEQPVCLLTKQNISPSMIDLKNLSLKSKKNKKQNPKHIKITSPQFEKPIVQEMEKRQYGRLKFFIKKRDFGFLSLKNGGEMFVHKLDLIESQIDVDTLIQKSKTHDIKLSFNVQRYMIRNKPSTKAVSLKIVEMKNLLK